MATEKQISANQENSKLSTGPTSEAGLKAASLNNFRHGLAANHHESFTFLPDENPEKFGELFNYLTTEHVPQSETELILVRRMAESEWLRARALRFQTECLALAKDFQEKKFALFLRYQTTHERAFYRALNELQSLREQKRKTEIGFESQQLKQAAEKRAAEALVVKQEAQNLRREQFAFKKIVFQSKNRVRPVAETGSSGLEAAA